MSFFDQCAQIIDSTVFKVSELKPSEWYEQNMVMPVGSAFSWKVQI